MSSQPPKPKRTKISTDGMCNVSRRLSKLDKDDLLEVARAGISQNLGQEVALNLAKSLLHETEIRMLHCVRCHEDYDPKAVKDRNNYDCVMNDHENLGMDRCEGPGPGGESYAFCYPCCDKMEDDDDPCFEGSHISQYGSGGYGKSGYRYWQDDMLEYINDSCSTCNPQEKKNSDDDSDDDDDDGSDK